MLLMLFNIGDDRFGIDAQDLLEVLPAVPLQTVHGMPAGVVGLLSWRAALVPVIDLDLLTLGQPCPARLSTRILVVRYRPGPPGARIGLRVQRADDTATVNPADFLETGLTPPAPPRFGGVLPHAHQPVQQVLPEQLLSEAVRASLFSQTMPT